MFRAVAYSLFAAGVLSTTAWAAVDFQKDIAPIFAEHCLGCHGPGKTKGGLSFATEEGALKKLEDGVFAIVAGKPEQSELLARLASKDPEQMMPPSEKTKRPTKADEEKLRQWIAEGAKWGAHWSYRRVKRPPVPQVKDPSARRNDIDAFVLAKLEERGIKLAPEADRATLIKRVHYDLLGLPPTPEQVDAFVADKAPDAYERMLDQALASPHFGERWGRHWLDKARYADSDGYEKDSPRPDAWRYRDWVIASLNQDQAFDQFTVEQLAGDLLPEATPEQRLATAFHRQSLTNKEGGVDQEQYRVEAVFDRTETTGAVWMGLTIGCARCHSHKYDQISQREYYQLFAFFNNGDDATAKVSTSPEALLAYDRENKERSAKITAAQAKVAASRAALEEKLPEWGARMAARLAVLKNKKSERQILTVSSALSAGKATLTSLPDSSLLASGVHPVHDVYQIHARLPAAMITGIRFEMLPDDSLPNKGPGRAKNGNFVLSEVRVISGGRAVKLHSPVADFSQEGWPVAAAVDGKLDKGWAISPQRGLEHWAEFQFAQPVDGAKTPELEVRLEQRHPSGSYGIGRIRMAALVGESEDAFAPKPIRISIEEGPEKWTDTDREELLDWLAPGDPATRAAMDELEALEADGPKPPLMEVRVIAQRQKQPRETKVLHRGEFLNPAEAVQTGGLSVLPPMKSRSGAAPDRLDLARWLVSRDHPLTARVAVNQLWAHLFGEGLARTVGDFGVRGERPTHPELLDWLADEFMAWGWSRKTIIRLIMTSATYRQRSQARPELAEIDPLNLLLARQNRLRVEGEIVRDLYLAASGQLDPKIGGPSVYPPLPPEVAAISYAGNFKWTESTGADAYRRGMYTFFKRTAPYPDLMVFDCPDANVALVKRTVSDTPLQALTTLNAVTFSHAARGLASRVLKEAPDDQARITRAFRLCLARAPKEDETRQLLALLETARAEFQKDPEGAKKLGAGDSSRAAWIAVTRVILNTDEFITRE